MGFSIVPVHLVDLGHTVNGIRLTHGLVEIGRASSSQSSRKIFVVSVSNEFHSHSCAPNMKVYTAYHQTYDPEVLDQSFITKHFRITDHTHIESSPRQTSLRNDEKGRS